jgi:UDP-2,3-diacylglucosamine pyrophosphatase LpxH
MNVIKRISKAFENAEQIPFDDSSKIVLMSDCHRGDGSWADDFSKNQNIYFAALSHYYREKYTYIELGDGDELWENSKFSEILQAHRDVYKALSKFHNEGRLYIIYGNHDIVKQDINFAKDNLYKYYDERKKKYIPLLENIKLHEALVLTHKDLDYKILLIHGHQVDCLNDTFWRLSRFLVKNLWRPLESIGISDPTSTAKNHEKKDTVEKRLIEWIKKEKHILIAGHTHRPRFPEVGEPPYFNDGSSVHPRCITAIEIEEGRIKLVKWSIKTRSDGTLYIGREVLAGPREIQDYFSFSKDAK